MKEKLIRFSRRYARALRSHLRSGASASLQPALQLGRRAVSLRVETLALARMHEQALAPWPLASRRETFNTRTDRFFAEALTPIVETHRAARQSKMNLNRLQATLNRRTLALAMTNLQLKRGIRRRKCVEGALKKSGAHYARLLKDSLQLQAGLRKLAHQVMVTQEEERKKISHELQDEVAQTLLGINIRLLSLKQESQANTKGLRSEIASTQRLVASSAKSVRRVAREFGNL